MGSCGTVPDRYAGDAWVSFGSGRAATTSSEGDQRRSERRSGLVMGGVCSRAKSDDFGAGVLDRIGVGAAVGGDLVGEVVGCLDHVLRYTPLVVVVLGLDEVTAVFEGADEGVEFVVGDDTGGDLGARTSLIHCCSIGLVIRYTRTKSTTLTTLTPTGSTSPIPECRRAPTEWARRSQSVSSKCRLMLSASFRRLYIVSKSGSPGGIWRTFSARLHLRSRSSSYRGGDQAATGGARPCRCTRIDIAFTAIACARRLRAPWPSRIRVRLSESLRWRTVSSDSQGRSGTWSCTIWRSRWGRCVALHRRRLCTTGYGRRHDLSLVATAVDDNLEAHRD